MKVPFSERVTMHPDFPRMISVYSCCLHVIMKSTPFVQKGPRWVIYYMIRLFKAQDTLADIATTQWMHVCLSFTTMLVFYCGYICPFLRGKMM
jgi:hypothetical protein